MPDDTSFHDIPRDPVQMQAFLEVFVMFCAFSAEHGVYAGVYFPETPVVCLVQPCKLVEHQLTVHADVQVIAGDQNIIVQTPGNGCVQGRSLSHIIGWPTIVICRNVEP